MIAFDTNNLYKISNGLVMYKSVPYNWKVKEIYEITNPKEINPIYLHIAVGSLDEMWGCYLDLENETLSISNMSYSSDTCLRFKIPSIDEAGRLVQQFVEGMKQEHNMNGTIYDD